MKVINGEFDRVASSYPSEPRRSTSWNRNGLGLCEIGDGNCFIDRYEVKFNLVRPMSVVLTIINKLLVVVAK